jgi:hypothetical protein
MKTLILSLLIAVTLVSCGPSYVAPPVVTTTAPAGVYADQTYETIIDPRTGSQMVVVNDNGTRLLFDMIWWNQYYNRLGYNGVINYYHSHPGSYYRPYTSYYSGWKRSTFRGSNNQPYVAPRTNSRVIVGSGTNSLGRPNNRTTASTNSFGRPQYNTTTRTTTNSFGRSNYSKTSNSFGRTPSTNSSFSNSRISGGNSFGRKH